jgi:hypothetical protein
VRPRLTVSSNARRHAVSFAVLLLVVGALGACTPRAGSAAVVGDTRFTTDEVQSSTRELVALAAELGQTGVSTADLNRRQVSRLVTEALLLEAAERRGVEATEGDVDSLISQSLQGGTREDLARQVAIDELVPVSAFDRFAEVVVLNQKLLAEIAPGEAPEVASAKLLEELVALSDELDVTVNPRFGTWDATSLDVGLPPNDLSSPPEARAVVTSGSQIQD